MTPADKDPTAPRRKSVLLRLDPAVHSAVALWAAAELRSVNAHVEWILRQALADAGRAPRPARAQRTPPDVGPGGVDPGAGEPGAGEPSADEPGRG